ncbi:MAG: hypothetical protein WAT39_04320 [Planctomycetota bacterium]
MKLEIAGHWLTAEVDVSTSKAVATRLGASAIPVAVALTGEGKIFGRILGFVEPDRFAAELTRLREAR